MIFLLNLRPPSNGNKKGRRKPPLLAPLRAKVGLTLEELHGHLRKRIRLGERKHAGLHKDLHLREVGAFRGKIYLSNGRFRGLE